MMTFRKFVLTATASLILLFSNGRVSVSDEPRLWTSADNMFKVNASLVSATEKEVRLKREDNGKEIVVPLTKLSEADHAFLKLTLESKKANKDSQKPGIQSGAKQTSNPGIPNLSLRKIDDSSYKLEPLGILKVPAAGFRWQVVKGQSELSYQAIKEGDPNVFTLTIHPSAVSNQDRKEFIQQDWEKTKAALVAGGGTYRNQVLPIQKDRFEYVEWLHVQSEDRGDEANNLVTYGFMAGVTLRIYHTGPQARMGGTMAADVLKKFNLLPEPDDKPIELPTSVAREIAERISLLKSLVAKKDFRSIMAEFTNAQNFHEFEQLSELQQNQAVERYAQTNGVMLKQLVSTLQVNEARYVPKLDKVDFPKSKPRMLTMLRSYGRWTLEYPKVIRDMSAADLVEAGGTESTLSAPQNQPVPGKELAISKIDDQWVMFSPYGKVLVPEKAFEWKLVDKVSPAIESSKIVMVEGNPNPQSSDLLRVEVHPTAVGESRGEFITNLEQQLTDKMKSSKARIQIESFLGDGAKSPVPEYVLFLLEGRSGSRRAVASYAACLFLSDKTILVYATVSGGEDMSGRAMTLVRAVVEGIRADSSWYPASTIDPKIRQQVSALIAEMQQMLAAGEYEKLVTRCLPPEMLAKIKESPGGMDELIKEFKERESIELVGELKKIDWKTAAFSESEKALSFGSSKLRFLLIDGVWRLR